VLTAVIRIENQQLLPCLVLFFVTKTFIIFVPAKMSFLAYAHRRRALNSDVT